MLGEMHTEKGNPPEMKCGLMITFIDTSEM